MLQVQHILRDKTGVLRGQDSEPKSLASHADHFRSIFVPQFCDLSFELAPVISISLRIRSSCRRDVFIDIHYSSQYFSLFIMGLWKFLHKVASL